MSIGVVIAKKMTFFKKTNLHVGLQFCRGRSAG